MIVESRFVLPEQGLRSGDSETLGATAPGAAEAAGLGLGVLFDRVLDAVIVARLSSGLIELWNPAAEKLFGYSAAEVIGQPVTMLMAPPIADLHRAGFERYLRTGHGLIVDATTPVEMPAQGKGGTALRIEMMLSELRDAHGERFAVAIVRDAIHRKRLELTQLELVQERLARSNAEASVAERDGFLEAVASTIHDLAAQSNATAIRLLSARLAEFSRLHGGQIAIEPIRGDLVELLKASVAAVRLRAPSRRVHVHAPQSAPALFDPERTREVLEHVLDEALHCSPGGATMEVRLEQPTPRSTVLTVRVQATGAPRELGVGLHVSRTVMQRQGGALTAMVSESGGFEVSLAFPGWPKQPRAKAAR